jgi:hypothetical protein
MSLVRSLKRLMVFRGRHPDDALLGQQRMLPSYDEEKGIGLL